MADQSPEEAGQRLTERATAESWALVELYAVEHPEVRGDVERRKEWIDVGVQAGQVGMLAALRGMGLLPGGPE